MSDNHVKCPDEAFLEHLAAGQAVAADVSRHVAGCPACGAALARIHDANRFLASFKSGGTWPATGDQSTGSAMNLPGYEIVREIRRGGQGVVYEAVQRSTKRTVAVKVMRLGRLATAAERSRFEREIEMLGRVSHPNIVAVHDAGVTGGLHYFVMDYVEGRPLDEALVVPPAGLPTVVGLFIRVCEAIHAAHLLGVIHRDLKPGNILVDGGGEPHILDFGIAKSLQSADMAMTRTGEFVGSLPWASPEQIEGESNKVDLRTDVYSLGAMLYQVLTGVVPFEPGGGLRETLDDILQRDPPRPREQAAARGVRIDHELETIVLKCLSKDRERRYQSAGELARDLRRYLAGEAIDAKRDSAWYVIRKTAWRKRRTLLAAAVPLVLLPVAVYALYSSAATARVAAQERTLRAVESTRNAAMLEIARRLQARPGSAPDSPGGELSRINMSDIERDLDTGGLSVADHGVALLLAQTLRDQGAVLEAEALARRAIVMLQRDHGPRHPEIGRMRAVLADILMRRRTRLPDALSMAERAVRELRAAFGQSGSETARGQMVLARAHLALGNLPQALASAEAALAADDSPRSIQRAEALATLADVRAARGDKQEARQAGLAALRSMLALTHDSDARLLDTLEVAASLVEREILAAEELFDGAALRGALAGLAPGGALREVAALLRGGADGTARDQSVIPARRLMIALRERLLGPEHPRLGASLAALAAARIETLRSSLVPDLPGTEEAIALLKRAVPLQIAEQGPDSPRVGTSYEKLGIFLTDACRLREAAQYFARDCELWMRQPAEMRDDYQILIRARWTAWHATRGGDYEAALPWVERSVDLVGRIFGPEDGGAALIHACRAVCLASLGRPVEAAESDRIAQRILETQPVPPDQRSECARFLGLARALLGRAEAAQAIMEPAWREAERNFAIRRPFFRLEWTATMRAYCRAIGDLERAEQFEQDLREHGLGDLSVPE